jgi:hypothetical protein
MNKRKKLERSDNAGAGRPGTEEGELLAEEYRRDDEEVDDETVRRFSKHHSSRDVEHWL